MAHEVISPCQTSNPRKAPHFLDFPADVPENVRPEDGAESLTVIRSPEGLSMAKRVVPGRDEGYSARRISRDIEPVAGLDALAGVLGRVGRDPHACRPAWRADRPSRTHGVRRLLHDRMTTRPASRREGPSATCRAWVALDMEGIERPAERGRDRPAAARAVAIATLPAAFHGVRCIVQATARHGIKPDIRLRLWFWLVAPTTARN